LLDSRRRAPIGANEKTQFEAGRPSWNHDAGGELKMHAPRRERCGYFSLAMTDAPHITWSVDGHIVINK
jgi:hypothetical protein